jgi:hypothetical protein
VGECVFLSPGGIGMIIWLLMGAAIWAYRAEASPVTRAGLRRSHVASAASASLGPQSLPHAAP